MKMNLYLFVMKKMNFSVHSPSDLLNLQLVKLIEEVVQMHHVVSDIIQNHEFLRKMMRIQKRIIPMIITSLIVVFFLTMKIWP